FGALWSVLQGDGGGLLRARVQLPLLGPGGTGKAQGRRERRWGAPQEPGEPRQVCHQPRSVAPRRCWVVWRICCWSWSTSLSVRVRASSSRERAFGSRYTTR